MEFIGIKDTFGTSGEPDELLVKFGLTSKEIAAAALTAVERKKSGSSGYRKLTD